MSRKRDENIFAFLLRLPWWASLVAAAIGFAVFGFVIPLAVTGNPSLSALGKASLNLAPYITGVLAFVVPFAFASGSLRGRPGDTHSGVDSIRAMNWQSFEPLIAEGFRRLGFAVEKRGGPTPDRGIDIDLHKDGKRTIVQCKHWRATQVGISPVRELYGVMLSGKANGALLVTSGTFTHEALAFAKDVNDHRN